MAFEKSKFIKPDVPFAPEYTGEDLAPLMRGRFSLGAFRRCDLRVCGLGYASYWINGQSVTEDLFVAPVSDYNKTLWYNVYDVTGLLREGDNVCAAWLGNGFFNESLKTSWDYDKAAWRDNPKLMVELVVDGEVAFVSDGRWRCLPDSAVTFNQLRSGEYFDARLYEPDWVLPRYDDSRWPMAALDENPPTGTLRECLCEPIRACKIYPSIRRWQVGEGRYVFDMGQNMMGYIRLSIRQEAGDVVTIRYAERTDDQGRLNLGRMREHYPESPFMTDRFTCDGKAHTWSPRFVYHGFRYIELDGVRGEPAQDMVSGVFIHQDVRVTGEFESSDETLNQMFRIGQMATLSNLAYMPTDCPTREKLGWANDAQASAEQMIANFGVADLFRKWLTDIYDAMTPEGALPGIIPTSGWGYEWGNGPVSDGVLFEVAHVLYLYTADARPLVESLPYFKRYLGYLKTREEEDGMVGFGLSDWSPPRPVEPPRTPTKLINTILTCKFLRIASLAARLAGEEGEKARYDEAWEARAALFRRHFIAPDGTCRIDEQTAVAMAIVHGLCDDLEPLKAQLLRLVEAFDFHHDCGMVGLRHLYAALSKCAAPDYAYRVITARGYPGYRAWLEGGATTLLETWQAEDSHNHHMYSDFMAWLIKALAGIRPTLEAPGFAAVIIEPAFVPGLDWVKGALNTVRGRISCCWQREGGRTQVTVSIPAGVKADIRLAGRAERIEGPAEERYAV